MSVRNHCFCSGLLGIPRYAENGSRTVTSVRECLRRRESQGLHHAPWRLPPRVHRSEARRLGIPGNTQASAIGSSIDRTRSQSWVRICANQRSRDLAQSASLRLSNSMPRRISARAITLVAISSTGFERPTVKDMSKVRIAPSPNVSGSTSRSSVNTKRLPDLLPRLGCVCIRLSCPRDLRRKRFALLRFSMDWRFKDDCPSKLSASPRQTGRPRCRSSCTRSKSTCLRPAPRPGRMRFFSYFICSASGAKSRLTGRLRGYCARPGRFR
jgi:hypothetical protein